MPSRRHQSRRPRTAASIAAAIAAVLTAPGCFVIEEIDAGSDYMEAHSPGASADAKKPSGDDESSDLASTGRETLDAVGEWWDEVGKPGPDPNDGIVRCVVRGNIQYTRESDCRASGGEPLED